MKSGAFPLLNAEHSRQNLKSGPVSFAIPREAWIGSESNYATQIEDRQMEKFIPHLDEMLTVEEAAAWLKIPRRQLMAMTRGRSL